MSKSEKDLLIQEFNYLGKVVMERLGNPVLSDKILNFTIQGDEGNKINFRINDRTKRIFLMKNEEEYQEISVRDAFKLLDEPLPNFESKNAKVAATNSRNVKEVSVQKKSENKEEVSGRNSLNQEFAAIPAKKITKLDLNAAPSTAPNPKSSLTKQLKEGLAKIFKS